jgi:hypothetical protein
MWLLLGLGCAGELRDPGRFSFLLDEDGGTNNMRDSGKPGPEAGAGGSRAPDSGTAEPVAPPPKCVTDLFTASCSSSVACHASGAAQVDLKSPGVERRLVGKSSAATGQCKDRILIATDGSDSLLLQKLDEPAPCGSTMPIGTPLSDDQRACLTDWVNSLAGDQ